MAEENENLVVFGRSLNVIKETERGIILLFQAQTVETVRTVDAKPFTEPTSVQQGDNTGPPMALKCSICMVVYTKPVTYRCGHTFCKVCIDAWLATDNVARKCPTCRKPLKGGHHTTYAIKDMVETYKKEAGVEDEPEKYAESLHGKEEEIEEEESEEEEEEEDSDDKKRKNSHSNSTGKKKQKTENTTTYTEYYLCGALCEEMTSPLLLYHIKIRMTKGNLYEVVDIMGVTKDFKTLTKASIRRCLTKSQYFGKGADGTGDTKVKAYVLKNINNALQPLVNVHGFDAYATIDGERFLNCLIFEKANYIFKNLFQDKDHYERVSRYGTKAIRGLSNEEQKTLDKHEDTDIDMQDEFDLADQKIDVFEKMCFMGQTSEEQKTTFLQEGMPEHQTQRLRTRVDDIWTASLLYHELVHAQKVFGEPCLKKRTDDNRWSKEVLSILKHHHDIVEVWKDDLALSDETPLYLLTKETNDIQKSIVRCIKGLTSLTCIHTEVDDDHDSSEGYFDRLRTLTRDKRASSVIVTPLKKRKFYLEKHTRVSVLTYDEAITAKNVSNYQFVIVDRCHVLGVKEFSLFLDHFSTCMKNLVLCGSMICMPETYGNPFVDIYNAAPIIVEIQDASQEEFMSDMPMHKIARSFDTMRQMLEEKKKRPGAMYVFVHTNEEKQQLEQDFPSELGKDTVKWRRQTLHALPARPTTCIFIRGSDMNRAHFAKCLACSSTTPECVFVVGTFEDTDRVEKKVRYPRKNILEKWLTRDEECESILSDSEEDTPKTTTFEREFEDLLSE